MEALFLVSWGKPARHVMQESNFVPSFLRQDIDHIASSAPTEQEVELELKYDDRKPSRQGFF